MTDNLGDLNLVKWLSEYVNPDDVVEGAAFDEQTGLWVIYDDKLVEEYIENCIFHMNRG